MNVTSNGFNCMIATFERVDGKTVTLGDLIPSNMDNSTLKFLDNGGAIAKVTFKGQQVPAEYQYFVDEDQEFDGTGWYLVKDYEGDLEINQNATEVPFGTGYYVYRSALDTSAKVSDSGSVKATPTTVTIKVNGFNTVGNCTPKQINLGDVVPTGMENSTLKFLDNGGAVAKADFKGQKVPAEYQYFVDEDDEFAGTGWYLVKDYEGDLEINQNERVKLAPGQGFMVYRSALDTGASIVVPSAL